MILLLTCWNTICFLTMGLDKKKARLNRRRIPELNLLAMALFMGAPGILAGMKIFRHKTKHFRFKLLVPMFLVLNTGLFILWVKYQL